MRQSFLFGSAPYWWIRSAGFSPALAIHGLKPTLRIQKLTQLAENRKLLVFRGMVSNLEGRRAESRKGLVEGFSNRVRQSVPRLTFWNPSRLANQSYGVIE